MLYSKDIDYLQQSAPHFVLLSVFIFYILIFLFQFLIDFFYGRFGKSIRLYSIFEMFFEYKAKCTKYLLA